MEVGQIIRSAGTCFSEILRALDHHEDGRTKQPVACWAIAIGSGTYVVAELWKNQKQLRAQLSASPSRPVVARATIHGNWFDERARKTSYVCGTGAFVYMVGADVGSTNAYTGQMGQSNGKETMALIGHNSHGHHLLVLGQLGQHEDELILVHAPIEDNGLGRDLGQVSLTILTRI
jgi:hypothetical protein